MNQMRTGTDRLAQHYVSTVQRANAKEINEAIEQVKGGSVKQFKKFKKKRRKRGYWTPVGFYWFNRRKKWRNFKKRTSGVHC